MTCVIAKICERIKDRWMEYLEEKELLAGRQYNFRRKRSCVTNFRSFHSRVIAIMIKKEMAGWTASIWI